MIPPPAQVARFALGGDQFGLDIMLIKEIIEPQTIKPVPHSPRFIDGVIEVRGAVIPAMELSKRFGTPPAPDPLEKRFIIVSIAGKLLALGVDAVTEIVRIEPKAYRPVPSLLKRPETRCFTGVARAGRELILVVDLPGLLRSEEEFNLSEIKAIAAESGAALSAQEPARP